MEQEPPSSPQLEEGTNTNPPSTVPPPLPSPSKTSNEVKMVTRAATIITIVISIPVLMAGICLLFMKDYDCEHFLELSRLRLAIGIGLILVFLLSNIVAQYTSNRPFLMAGFLVVMIPFVIMFIMGFALVGVYKTESRGVPASPGWLKHKISQMDYWVSIKKCIYDSHVCDNFGSRMIGLKWRQFKMKTANPVENGCCRPPSICGMQYVNATNWKDGGEGLGYQPLLGGDCSAWSNDQTMLCYDCQSCKVGFRRYIETKWHRLGTFLVLVSILLILVHLIRFGAKHNQ